MKFLRSKSHCKHESYSKAEFLKLTQDHIFETEGSSTVKVNFDLPDGWTTQNTRIIEARRTRYNKQSDGAYNPSVNGSEIIPQTTSFVMNSAIEGGQKIPCTTVLINHSGYNFLGQPGDFTIQENVTDGVIGDKNVYELFIMKVE